jgi:hypothetical protein
MNPMIREALKAKLSKEEFAKIDELHKEESTVYQKGKRAKRVEVKDLEIKADAKPDKPVKK